MPHAATSARQLHGTAVASTTKWSRCGYGLETMYIGGGQGMVAIFERAGVRTHIGAAH